MKKTFSVLFLLVYIGLLISHVVQMQLETKVFPFLFAGLLIAVVAHLRKHWSSIPFLVVHMVLEAIEFSSVGFSFTAGILLWVLIHIGMDIVFLWDEVRRHFFSARYILISSILIAVGSIYLFSPTISGTSGAFLELYHEQIEVFIIGGIIGCVLSHLIPHRHTHA